SHAPTYVNQSLQYGSNQNAASAAGDALWGAAFGSANAGTGALALPELHSGVVGGTSPFPYAWNYSQVQGVMGFEAINPVTIDLPDFVGVLDFTSGGSGLSTVSAALAILDTSLTNAIASTYFTSDGVYSPYGFANDCNSPSALAIGGTGYNAAKGSVTQTLA